MKTWLRIAFGLTLLVASLLAFLWAHPPELIRVGANYTAKIICSNVFLAGRDAQEVLRVDVQAPGHPLLRIMRAEVNMQDRTVRAGLFGFIGHGLAVARDGTGCATVADGDLEQASAHHFLNAAPTAATGGVWPEGDGVSMPAQRADWQALLADDKLAGPGLRAVLVVQGGRIVAERYGAGFSPTTRLLGWSMTKTANALLLGTLVKQGRIALNQDHLFADWASDERARIRVSDLLSMTSGLAFNESYGDVSDVTRMLYLEPDMLSFVRQKKAAHPVGQVWDYSSGTSLLISGLWQQALPPGTPAMRYAHDALFAPLGMTSAVLEADARGLPVGPSYLYATARDWARLGQFLLQDGVWQGQALVPDGFVRMMQTPAPKSNGKYGLGQLWRKGPEAGTPPDQDADQGFTLPPDTFWLEGHDGQSIAVVPSQQLVVVRLGLTPNALNYKPQALLQALTSTPR